MSALHVDDIFENFFHFLWVKDDIYQMCNFDFSIPDTIIVKNDTPTHWYFSSKGTIKRKKALNIKADKIVSDFLKSPSKSGAVAVFLYSGQYNVEEKGTYDEIQKKIVVEYLDQEGLSTFLA